MSDQKIEQAWATPTHQQIIELTKQHVAALEGTDVDAAWVQAGMHHIVLRTVGRKTGAEHKIALPVWNDANGDRIVVASFAGHEKHPAWFVNLRDRTANPEVLCRAQTHSFWSVPEILLGAQRVEPWAQLTQDRAWYNDYQNKTSREIPLVRLPETRPAE